MSLVSGISGAGRKARRKATKDQPEVVLGEDWIAPDASVRGELAARQDRRGLISINRSPLARKIISFNMVAILVLVAGILYLNPFRESLVYQRDIGLGVEAELLSEVIAARLPATGSSAQSATLANVFEEFDPPSSSTVLLYDLSGNLVATSMGRATAETPLNRDLRPDFGSTLITDFLHLSWDALRRLVGSDAQDQDATATGPSAEELAGLVELVLQRGEAAHIDPTQSNSADFAVATPIRRGAELSGHWQFSAPLPKLISWFVPSVSRCCRCL